MVSPIIPAPESIPQASQAAGVSTVASAAQTTRTTNTTGSSYNTANLLKSFEQILTLSMMSGMSNTSGAADLTGSGSGDSSSSMNMMMPMMLMLMEQLLAQSTQSQTAQSSQAQAAADPLTGFLSPDQAAVGTALTNGLGILPMADRPTGRPVGGVITQGYHSTHHGFDFGVPVGTPIHATMSGKVVYAGWNEQGYGNLVIVENGPYRTYYGHQSSIQVKVGDTVYAGNTVGLSGNTGNSTGPHLHYEVRLNNQAIDPTSFTLSQA